MDPTDSKQAPTDQPVPVMDRHSQEIHLLLTESACPTPASPEVTPKSPYLEPMVPPPAPYTQTEPRLVTLSAVLEMRPWPGRAANGSGEPTYARPMTNLPRRCERFSTTRCEAWKQFRILAGESGYNDCALRYSFLWGLNEAMQIELACRDEPESFEALVELAIRIDGRLQGRRRQRRGGSHVSTAGGFQRLLPALTPAAPAPSPLIDGGPAFLVERVLDVRQRGCDLHYLVEWEGHGPEERSWIPASHFLCPDLIQDFHRDHPRALRRGSGGPRRGGRSVRPQTRMVAGGACLPITGPASNDSSTSKCELLASEEYLKSPGT
ncbi:uncharacterized protein LOC144209188 isoform X5 [Stigmatopora nigra]